MKTEIAEQTREQAIGKINQLLAQHDTQGDFITSLKKECKRLIESGAIPFQNYENNFAIPKTVLSVALQNMAYQYSPIDNQLKKVAKNLSHF